MAQMKNKNPLYPYLLCALFAALTAVCSQIMIPLPFTPVPINLALLAVFTCGGVLGAKRGALAILVYILLGAVGVPVFVGLGAGLGILAGPTGGYIVGYIPAVIVFGLLCRGKAPHRNAGAEGVSSNDGRVGGSAAAEQASTAAEQAGATGYTGDFAPNRKRAIANVGLTIIRGIPAAFACYALGTFWFMHLMGTGFAASLLMCVVPFIPGDILKIVAAAAITEALRRPMQAIARD